MGLHYCLGELKTVSLFGKADDCGFAEWPLEEACDYKDSDSFKEKRRNCCDDQLIVVEAVDQQGDEALSNTSNPKWVASFVHNQLAESLPASLTRHIAYVNYSPPFLEQNFQVDFQLFLI